MRWLGPLKRAEWLMLAVFALVASLWMTTALHGVHYSLVALAGVAALLLARVLDWDDVLAERGAWDVFIWYGGLVRMAGALGESGITRRFAEFAGGLREYLESEIGQRPTLTPAPFAGTAKTELNGHEARVEWAVWWPQDEDGFLRSYCNTIYTLDGGFHEAGFRAAIAKGLKAYAELVNNRKASIITQEDVMNTGAALVSVFIRDPQFEGQTKGRLVSTEAAKIVEQAVRDPFDHWLAANTAEANRLLEWSIQQAEDRQRRRKEKEISRQSATRKLRLPGKLTDCSRAGEKDTELFLV